MVLLTLVAAPIAAVVLKRKGEKNLARQFAPAWWMIAFLLWLGTLSALGSKEFGGHGVIPGGVDIALVGLSALGFYFWAVRSGVKAHLAGLPGPDPVLDATDAAPAPAGQPHAPERELSRA